MTQEEIYAENERIMAQYRPYITKKVLDRYGTSFQNAENLGDSWRDNILYSPAVEEFLVLETRVFIRLYTNTDNLWAIRALVKMISGYLAVFVQMAPDTGSLNRARKKLKHLLFDESDFVQHIINQKKAEHDQPAQSTRLPSPGNRPIVNTRNANKPKPPHAKQNWRKSRHVKDRGFISKNLMRKIKSTHLSHKQNQTCDN